MSSSAGAAETWCCFPLCAVGTALVEADVPVEVAMKLADVVRAGQAGPADGLDRPDLRRRTMDSVLGVIESRDAVTSWADSVAVDAARELTERVAEELRPAPVEEMTKGQREAWRSDTRMEVAGEIEAATGTGITAAHKLVRLASAPVAATGRMLAGLRAGKHRLHRLEVVMEATSDLPPDAVAEIAEVVFQPRRDGAPKSHQQFRRALRREVAKLAGSDAEAARRARAKARQDRRVDTDLWQDGVGQFAVSGSWERVVAARSRVDEIARRFRAAGDERTLDQLRSDVALDLMLFGDVCAPQRGDDRPGGPQVLGEYRQLGALPPAHVDVVVSLSTLLGLDDGVGEMPGHGFLTAEHVREVALAAGSVWRRLVADPLDGRAIERSIQSYRPDAAMREQVQAMDGVCRGPGCTVPATQCDIDHVRDYREDGSGGETAEPNLEDLHRRHHNVKTKGLWTCEKHGDGVVHWRTLIGRRYSSEPFDYRQFLCGYSDRGGEPEQWQRQPFDPGSYRQPDADRAAMILGPVDQVLAGEIDRVPSGSADQVPADRADRVSADAVAGIGDLRVPRPGELDTMAGVEARRLMEDALACLLDDALADGDRSNTDRDRDDDGGRKDRRAGSSSFGVDWVAGPSRFTFEVTPEPPPF